MLTQLFNIILRYIDDVFSLNISRFSDLIVRIYPTKLEIDDITDSPDSASKLELNLEIQYKRQTR
jgi:hypothetical protein